MTFNPNMLNAVNLVQNITKNNPQRKKIVDFLMSQGLSENDISAYMSGGQHLTESQRSDIGRKIQGKQNVQKLLDVLKMGVQVAGGAAGAYALYKGGKTLASTILGQMETPKAKPASLAGTILENTPQPTEEKKPGIVKSLIGGIAGLFGFKNKQLVSTVSDIVQKTGKDVKEVYNELSKQDISTPEKATNAAQNMLKQLTGEGKILKPEDISSKIESKEKLKTAKTIAESKKDLAKTLKSAVIRKMNYNPEANELDVIFNNDKTYRYYDFPEDQFKKLSEGATPAKTSGRNEYGIWWTGKNPSAGATFSDMFKPWKKQAGPYTYQMIGTTPLTEGEAEEFKSVQGPEKRKTARLISGSEKAETASSAIKKAIPKVLQPEQQKARIMILTKQLDELRKKEPSERTKDAIGLIEKRLKDIEELNKILKFKKSTVLKDEFENYNKRESDKLLKKLVLLLPKALAKNVREKLANTSEEDILKYITSILKK